MKFIKICFLLVCLFASTNVLHARNQTKSPTKQTTKPAAKILLIPLDDRPPCLQFPVKMGLIADAEIVAPPVELLGKFTDAGKSDRIIEWLEKQDLKSFDAAIVSVDMLAYGGLVAMRVHDATDKTALKRLEFVRAMRKAAPRMKIYASSVIMRLAPTGTLENESYRADLARWAEISVDPILKQETAKLEAKIPAEALANYKAARARDLKINRATVDLVKNKTVDYLILSQDDAKPKGVHVADRENLIAYTKKLKLTERIAVQPGADEVSMLLLSRALTDKYDFHPKIRAIYSSEATKNQVMPYEDRPLNETVSFQIKAAGGIEVAAQTDGREIDIEFFVYASRFEPNAARDFAAKVWNGKNVVVADIDPKGDLQGADVAFVEFLINPASFLKDGAPKIPASYANMLSTSGYASWNTAGNTIGTALPQGILAGLATDDYFDAAAFAKVEKVTEKMSFDEKTDFFRRTATAHDWFILHRLIDDYAYHSIVRPKAQRLIRENKWNAARMTDEQTKIVEEFCLKELQPVIAKIADDYQELNKGKCEMSPVAFKLPWNRAFEAEINFDLRCAPVSEK